MNQYICINTERAHIFSPDIHVGVVAKIDRAVSADRVHSVISALGYRHPLLTATITFDEVNVAYYKLNSAKPIQITFVEDEDSSIWKNWMTTTNQTPFDFQNGPLMKLLVIQSREYTTFAALGHHLLGDGLSFVYFMRDFLMALDHRLDDAQLFPAHYTKRLIPACGGTAGLFTKASGQKTE